MKKPLNHLLVSAFVYAALGVASGVFFREFTKFNDFPEGAATQLGVAHTHLLALGFFPFLIFLALERLFRFSRARRRFGWFLGLYHGGLVLTSAMLIIHGTMTVLGIETSAMIAGLAGLGHMLITAAFVLLFVLLRAGIRRSETEAEQPLSS